MHHFLISKGKGATGQKPSQVATNAVAAYLDFESNFITLKTLNCSIIIDAITY